MKLLMILVDADDAPAIEAVLEDAGVPGYTELPTVLGKGETGRKLGTRAFPGSSTMLLAAVTAERAPTVIGELGDLRTRLGPREGFKVFSIDATAVL